MTDQFSWSHLVCHIQVHLYLVHRFINCRGTPHVCLACAGTCRGTIMFKIVCLKIYAVKLETEALNCSKYFLISRHKKSLRIRTLIYLFIISSSVILAADWSIAVGYWIVFHCILLNGNVRIRISVLSPLSMFYPTSPW